MTAAPTGQPADAAPGPPLAEVLTGTRRLLGCHAGDVPVGVSVADALRIGRVVEATGDENPLFLDPGYGARSWWRTLIAPPSFVLAVMGPESRGALEAGTADVVDILGRIELWWRDHVRLGDRVGASLELVGAGPGPPWRGRDTVDVLSRARYLADGREVATAVGTVRIHPLRHGHELFVEREMHRYGDDEVGRLVGHLDRDPEPRGSRPRFFEDVSVAERLPEMMKGPLNWSDLITWIIAEGRAVVAGNLLREEPAAGRGSGRLHPVTGWPVADRRNLREDLQACREVGFPAPPARPALLAALAIQLVTTWMGDDAFLRHLSISLDAPALYGDGILLSGRVADKFTQRIGGRRYHAVWLEITGTNQLAERVLGAEGLVFLPARGHPVELPVDPSGPPG